MSATGAAMRAGQEEPKVLEETSFVDSTGHTIEVKRISDGMDILAIEDNGVVEPGAVMIPVPDLCDLLTKIKAVAPDEWALALREMEMYEAHDRLKAYYADGGPGRRKWGV